MREKSFEMKQRYMHKINGSRGVVALSTIILIGAITVIGVGALYNSQMNVTIAQNYKKRIQSFYASDGMMTLLAQEVIDRRGRQYIDTTVACSSTEISYSGTTVFASTALSSASNAIDNNTGSRWESQHNHDPEWLRIDFGSPKTVCRVEIEWENADAKDYEIQGSTDGNSWIPIVKEYNSDNDESHQKDDFSGMAVTYRYFRFYGISRQMPYGYSFYEMNFFEGQISNQMEKTEIGKVEVGYKLEENITNCFNLETESFLANAAGKNPFRTPLKQYLELPGGGFSVSTVDSVAVPVTFYDFHSNRSNPEFEQPHMAGHYGFGRPASEVGRWKGMVADTLDSDRKPVLGPKPHLNYYVKYWFRPWSDAVANLSGLNGAQGDSTIPIYERTTIQDTTVSIIDPFDGIAKRRWDFNSRWAYAAPSFPTLWWGNPSCDEMAAIDSNLIAVDKLKHDTAFKNIVIEDTLYFELSDSITGTYRFSDNSFFPLDGKGFGSEWTTDTRAPPYPHNFSYTMVIHRTFVKVPGLKFFFRGDDDVWLFIDNRLVLDIGGLHVAFTDSVLLDTIPGLQNFQTYNFDFFYCERHSSNSSIRINTNIINTRPVTLKKRSWSRDYGVID